MAFTVLPDDDLELLILGLFYAYTQTQDRSGNLGCQRNYATGLPESPNDLLPRHKAVSGKKLAMLQVLRPEGIASAVLYRPVGPNERKRLKYFPPDQWTDVELEMVDDLEFQIKVLVHQLTEKHGWFILKPKGGNPYDPDELLEYGDDGFTRAFQITWPGLKEACARVPGSRWDKGPSSLKDDVGAEIWKDQTPDWYKDEVG